MKNAKKIPSSQLQYIRQVTAEKLENLRSQVEGKESVAAAQFSQAITSLEQQISKIDAELATR